MEDTIFRYFALKTFFPKDLVDLICSTFLDKPASVHPIYLQLSNRRYVLKYKFNPKINSNCLQFNFLLLESAKKVTPHSLITNSNNDIILTDFGNHRVLIYTQTGNFKHSFGCRGSEPGNFSGPTGLALDIDENLYVADTYNSRIQKFNSKFEHILEFKIGGNIQLSFPRRIAICPKNRIYVVDGINILIYDNNGNCVASITEYGHKPIRDIAINNNGVIYIVVDVDQGTKIFKYNQSYQLIGQIGKNIKNIKSIIADSKNILILTNSTNSLAIRSEHNQIIGRIEVENGGQNNLIYSVTFNRLGELVAYYSGSILIYR